MSATKHNHGNERRQTGGLLLTSPSVSSLRRLKPNSKRSQWGINKSDRECDTRCSRRYLWRWYHECVESKREYWEPFFNLKIKPRSPYGASKAAARHLVKVYRESHGLYAVHGILFNHEGTKRGEEFVTRKITKNVARLKRSLNAHLESGYQSSISPMELGNLDA